MTGIIIRYRQPEDKFTVSYNGNVILNDLKPVD